MPEKKSQENRPTASNLFFEAFLKSTETHAKGAEEAEARGSTEVEKTHVRKLIESLGAISHLIDDPDFQYPRLTPSENGTLRRLETMEEIMEMPPADSDLLAKLRKQAWNTE